MLTHLERFVCMLYRTKVYTKVNELRWFLYLNRAAKGESLPTTIGSPTTHVRRAHYIVGIWNKASESHPCLPSLTEFDWTLDATTKPFDPVRCFYPPAPEAMMKLVKCGCKIGCTGNCSCQNNKIPCTESKLQRLGFLPRNSPSFAVMCGTADEFLSASVLRNEYHVLAQLVTPIKETPYQLRPRAHNRSLPVANTLMRKNFVTRMLYKDSY